MDQKAINTIRCLAADVVQGANSGHPGAPMGCAPMAHVLFSRFISCNPKNPNWINRDRFVLSNGHGCALQYVMLHLMGYDVSMDDLKQFRQLHSKTPGHPERGDTAGVEVTTGPLGQGISNAVGMAIAERHLAATFNKPGFELINNTVYCIAGDGCLQEGVSGEASSLAGHLGLGNLVVLYDSNKIQIDGSTELGFTENVRQRYEAYGWNTMVVEDGDHDVDALAKAVEAARAQADRPTLIEVKTIIGFGATKQGTHGVHGAPLGADDIRVVKAKFGLDPEQLYSVTDDVYKLYGACATRGAEAESAWAAKFAQYKQQYAVEAQELERRLNGELPAGVMEKLPRFTPADKAVATRKLSEMVIQAIAPSMPELVGGSADLTGSNLTRWREAEDFQKPSSGLGSYGGRYLRFGVREHGMAAICNGMAAYGAIRPFASTFLNFISYAAGASRLSALSKLPVLYIMTHDSIGLGEDGPTHQPIETLAMLRATPNTLTFRPADGNETSGAYMAALLHKETPSVLSLTRQNLPQLHGSSVEAVAHGGYILQDTTGTPDVILVGTGSEVAICVESAAELKARGIAARVVSMPCCELFDTQSAEYRATVLPSKVPVVSVEALTTLGWKRYANHCIGIDSFGASGKIEHLYDYFGLVPNKIADRVEKIAKFYAQHPLSEVADF